MTDKEVGKGPKQSPVELTYESVALSRRKWLDEILAPWCKSSSRKELRLAEGDWVNLAGKVAPEKSLWFWAWSRFPDLVEPELQAINETHQIRVTIGMGDIYEGYPDARESTNGVLVLLCRDPSTGRYEQTGPFSLDDIRSVERIQNANQ